MANAPAGEGDMDELMAMFNIYLDSYTLVGINQSGRKTVEDRAFSNESPSLIYGALFAVRAAAHKPTQHGQVKDDVERTVRHIADGKIVRLMSWQVAKTHSPGKWQGEGTGGISGQYSDADAWKLEANAACSALVDEFPNIIRLPKASENDNGKGVVILKDAAPISVISVKHIMEADNQTPENEEADTLDKAAAPEPPCKKARCALGCAKCGNSYENKAGETLCQVCLDLPVENTSIETDELVGNGGEASDLEAELAEEEIQSNPDLVEEETEAMDPEPNHLKYEEFVCRPNVTPNIEAYKPKTEADKEELRILIEAWDAETKVNKDERSRLRILIKENRGKLENMQKKDKCDQRSVNMSSWTRDIEEDQKQLVTELKEESIRLKKNIEKNESKKIEGCSDKAELSGWMNSDSIVLSEIMDELYELVKGKEVVEFRFGVCSKEQSTLNPEMYEWYFDNHGGFDFFTIHDNEPPPTIRTNRRTSVENWL